MRDSGCRGDGGHVTPGLIAAALVSAVLFGCSSGPTRPELTEAQLQERSAADLTETVATFRNSATKILNRFEQESDSGGVINVLAMSGGGDYGAFGAGFLVGWGQVTDPEWRRPDFDVVSGVSTGALLAPFAFLGTDESCLQVENFYRDPKEDWVRERGLLFFLPSNPSFMDIPGLNRDVRGAINDEFIQKIAAESRKGKVLVITATNLDYGRQKFWDLGHEAENATTKEGIDRVQRILMASAAIPAVFPPVLIDEQAYADGGVTANVFLKLEPKDPNSLISQWRAKHPGKKLPKARYWVIVNNQVHQPPTNVKLRWPSVAGPSLATAIRSATLAEIRWLSTQVDYVNAVYDADIELRVVAIPDDWRAPVAGDFKKETMDSLCELGRKLGSDPSSWKIWAQPDRAVKTGAAGN